MSRASDLSVLCLSDACTLEELRARYKELALSRHPDHGGDAAAFAELGAAYRRLLKEVEKPRPCPACDGKGYTTIGVGFIPFRSRCDECRGRGRL